ncbi:FAD-dependent monooxygenase [Sphingomonas donggukensis]|uniref:FAD-dependent monooxygenase n=1 Tax=Sphingomonas donggukensis TaxID=2949093 RepID=A0ABY4TXE5_9SPHN|nr:NAD(P)/FAD-dependent oxidoreductase [Sphingomonas donggukensis]URW76659.1 FAD-dependent monooxygenase [Sphingomonas donggukensis]
MSRSAIVVGAGIAGLSTAIALRRAGWGVTVLERAPVLEPAGAALSLWPNAIAALRRLGVADAIETAAAPIHAMRVADRADRTILQYDLPRGQGAPGAFLPTRSLLQRALLDGVRDIDLRLGQAVAGVTQDGGGATVRLGDGSATSAHLVILADGIWSPHATALIGNTPRYRGYGGVLGISRTRAAPTFEAREYWGARERFGVFDLEAGGQYWFWMRDRSVDADPVGIDEVRTAAEAWPADVTAAVAATTDAELIPFAVHARAAPRQLGRGRILCVGDAAHAMEPNLGQGGCQGIEDAAAIGTLAQTLAADEMLPAFEAMRLRRIRAMVRRSGEGRLGGHASWPVRGVWRALMRAMPATITAGVISEMHRLP